MKNIGILLLLILINISCQNSEKKDVIAVNYPMTKKADSVDTYFGTTVKDPYRWLEDDRSEETEKWVKEENAVTFGYLEKIPFREDLKNRLEQLWNYEKLSSPFNEGDYTYFYKNDGLQNQYVLYRQKENQEAEVFLDPNSFSEDGTTSLMGLSFTEDGSLAAYAISEGGSDWRKVIVMETENKTIVEDTLIDVKFSGLSWYKNEGLYYSSYDKPEGSELSAKTDQHKLYYHKLGTPQNSDELIFGGIPEEKHRYVGANVTEDNKYLLISAANSTAGNKLYLKDLSKSDNKLITILDHEDSDTDIIENVGSKLYFVTNLDAPNKKIIAVDASNPGPANWEDIIPETEHVLSPNTGGGYFFAEYMVDAISKVLQYDYNGKLIREIKLPGIGNANGFGGKKEEKEFYFSFTNYNT
ncbi:MAG: S9 family peptidase, partial [Eudoraea sp.]|nr:S9 family peptidase [Eudoraea sp.]